MKYLGYTLLFFAVLLAGPLYILAFGDLDLKTPWSQANRASAGIAPDPAVTQEAVIQGYAARAYNWRGMFGMHAWLALKPAGAKQFTVYQVIGWRAYHGLPIVDEKADIPDRNWFGHKPHLFLDIRGAKAETLIPKVKQAIKRYPYPKEYVMWPGPNSNSFIAYVGRQVPELGMVLPGMALGKDYLPGGCCIAKTTAGHGYQFSLFGLLGAGIGVEQGLRINMLGLEFGIDPKHRRIILPGLGDVKIL